MEKELQYFYIDGAYESRKVEIILKKGDFLVLKYKKDYGGFPSFYTFSANFTIVKEEDKNRYKTIKEFEYDKKTRKKVLEEVNKFFSKLKDKSSPEEVQN